MAESETRSSTSTRDIEGERLAWAGPAERFGGRGKRFGGHVDFVQPRTPYCRWTREETSAHRMGGSLGRAAAPKKIAGAVDSVQSVGVERRWIRGGAPLASLPSSRSHTDEQDGSADVQAAELYPAREIRAIQSLLRDHGRHPTVPRTTVRSGCCSGTGRSSNSPSWQKSSTRSVRTSRHSGMRCTCSARPSRDGRSRASSSSGTKTLIGHRNRPLWL